MSRLGPPARRLLAGLVALLLLAFSAGALLEVLRSGPPLRLSAWGNGVVVDCSGSGGDPCFREVPFSHLAARATLLVAAGLAAWGAWRLSPRPLRWAGYAILAGWALHALGYVVPDLTRPVTDGRGPLWLLVALGYPLALGLGCVKLLKLSATPPPPAAALT